MNNAQVVLCNWKWWHNLPYFLDGEDNVSIDGEKEDTAEEPWVITLTLTFPLTSIFKKVQADDILYFSVYQIIKNQNQQWNDAIKKVWFFKFIFEVIFSLSGQWQVEGETWNWGEREIWHAGLWD